MLENLFQIKIGVFLPGWLGKHEPMKEMWIYGKKGENKRNNEIVKKRESEWRRVSDQLLEEDFISVVLLGSYLKMKQEWWNKTVLVNLYERWRSFDMDGMSEGKHVSDIDFVMLSVYYSFLHFISYNFVRSRVLFIITCLLLYGLVTSGPTNMVIVSVIAWRMTIRRSDSRRS